MSEMEQRLEIVASAKVRSEVGQLGQMLVKERVCTEGKGWRLNVNVDVSLNVSNSESVVIAYLISGRH